MPIRQMINTREPGTPREFQQRLTVVGKIRLGVFATPEGKRGRPEKIDTFRFTSPTEGLIRGAAGLYGGTVEQWTPQGGKAPQWAVVSDARALPVYIVNGQDLDPNYEAWGGGRTCLRRCDGVWNRIGGDDGRGTPCVCNGERPPAVKDMCKITLRAQLMLQELPGIGSWMLETHGENAIAEISSFNLLVRNAPMPVPAILRLREEARREWNPDKDPKPGFESRSFYVPWFDISFLTAQQVAIGGDALTQALTAAGAPAALGSGVTQHALPAASAQEYGPVTDWLSVMERATTLDRLEEVRREIAEARPHLDDATYDELGAAWVKAKDRVLAAGQPSALTQAAAPETAAVHEANPVAKLADALDAQDPGLVAMAEKNGLSVAEARAAILAQIEACDTTGAIEDLVGKFKTKGIGDKAIKDAAKARYAAIVAAAEVGGSAPGKTSVSDHQAPLRAAQRAESQRLNDAAIASGVRSDATQVIDAVVVDDQGPPPDWAVSDPSPAITYDLNTEMNAVYTAAGGQGWTTTQTNTAIRTAAGVEKMSEVGPEHAERLHALSIAVAAGEVSPS